MNDRTQEEIADCAHCGGSAYEAFDFEPSRKPPMALAGSRIECSACEQNGPTCTTGEEALARWNQAQRDLRGELLKQTEGQP